MAGILDLFIPKDRKFFDMLKDLSGKTHEGAKLFYNFVSNYGRLSPEKRKSLVEELKKIEHDCDSITHSIAIELNKTFLTPIDREDIHRLSTLIDDVMDIAYNMSHKFVLYKMQRIPKYMPELASVMLECVAEVDQLVSTLGERHKADAHIERIHALERKADSLRNDALAYLFSGSFSAVEIIKLRDIYEWLEDICDTAEDVADVVEGIVIKYA